MKKTRTKYVPLVMSFLCMAFMLTACNSKAYSLTIDTGGGEVITAGMSGENGYTMSRENKNVHIFHENEEIASGFFLHEEYLIDLLTEMAPRITAEGAANYGGIYSWDEDPEYFAICWVEGSYSCLWLEGDSYDDLYDVADNLFLETVTSDAEPGYVLDHRNVIIEAREAARQAADQ